MIARQDPLAGVRLKLKRAWNQLDTLKADIEAFFNPYPYRPTIQFNKQTQRLTIKVQTDRSPDPMWGVRVGEIIHDFRSALDHVVWELAGRPPARTSKTQFPIFEYEAGFSDRGVKQFLKGISDPKAIVLIKSEQPFFARE